MRWVPLVLVLAVSMQAQGLIDPYRFAAAVNTNTLNNGLIAYWKMDETSGIRVDSGGNGLNLTDINSVGFTTGIITNAADFVPASTQYLNHADDPLLSPGDTDFTFAVWVYPDFTGTAKTIFGKASASNAEYYLRHDGASNSPEFGVSGNGTTYTTVIGSLNSLSPANAWYFIVVTHDATANTITVQVNNGSTESSGHTTGVFNGTAAFEVGKNTLSPYWDGRIDEFGYWSRILTTDEKTYLYNSGAARTCCPYP
jgi:hypothetical protein